MQSQNEVKWRWIRAVWAFNYSSFVANWMDFRYFWVKIKTVWRSSRVILSAMEAYTFIIRNQFRKIVQNLRILDVVAKIPALQFTGSRGGEGLVPFGSLQAAARPSALKPTGMMKFFKSVDAPPKSESTGAELP